MKRTVKKISDELAFQIIEEYLSTDISQSALKKKYNFGGNNNRHNLELIFITRTLDTFVK